MFNSCGNRGNILGRGNVLPFEVLGKWMGRYAMWQLEFANDLFIDKGGTLGAPEICYDVNKDFMTIQGQTGCLGRDLMHNGPKCHEVFADIVYNDIKNNKVFSPEWVKLDVDC